MPALVNQQKFFSLPAAAFSVSCFLFFSCVRRAVGFLAGWAYLRGSHADELIEKQRLLSHNSIGSRFMQYNIIQSIHFNTKQHNRISIPRNKGFCHIFPSKVDLTCSWLQPPARSEFKDFVFFSFFSMNSSFAHISTKHNWICRCWAWIVSTCFLWRPDFRPQLNQINFDFKLNSPPCLCLCLSSNWV